MTASPSQPPRWPLVLGLALLAGFAAPPRAGAQADPPATELLRAADRYLLEFISRFSNVVAEERYEQWTTNELQRRTLVSDYLIVQIPATNDWVAFRDVLEADGAPVRDGGERLLALLLADSSASTLDRAREIAAEGARYNLRGIGLNDPLLAMAFVQLGFNQRFTWTVTGSAPDVGPDVWELAFEETTRPTILRNPDDGDVPAAGSVWVEALTGRILRTELRAGDSEVATRFVPDSQFGIAVPAEMRETHFDGAVIMRTVATYGRFRSFSVESTETFEDPPTR